MQSISLRATAIMVYLTDYLNATGQFGAKMSTFQSYEFKFEFGYGSSIDLQANYADSEVIAILDITEEFIGPVYGHVWSIARKIVQSGIDWPDWEIYHIGITEKYRTLLGGEDEFRYAKYNSKQERMKIMWNRYELSCQLYESEYVPEGVRMPFFMEGLTGSLSDFRKYGEEVGLSSEALDSYFLGSFDIDRICLLEDLGSEDSSKGELIECGVIRIGSEIDRKVMASCLNFSEAKFILKKLEIKPDRSLGKCREQLIDLLDEDVHEIGELILSARDWSLYGETLAIPGYEWDDFQSLRQQVRGAATAMVDIRDKKVSRDLTKKLR